MPLQLFIYFELVVVHLSEQGFVESELRGVGVVQDVGVIFAAAEGALHLSVQVGVVVHVAL